MTLGPLSRYAYTRTVKAVDSARLLAGREPYGFVADNRNRMHVVQRGDTLWTLAEKYFSGYTNAADLWWIIADYQNPPVVDPTIALEPGTQLVVPPSEVVVEIFSARRFDVPQVY